MGMGHAAGHADTIDNETLQKVCPEEYQVLLDELDKEDIDLDYFAEQIQAENDLNQDLLKVLDDLAATFKYETGLTICLQYHDQENGDRYDELEGAYWDLDGVYTMTLQAKTFIKKFGPITRQSFVEYG